MGEIFTLSAVMLLVLGLTYLYRLVAGPSVFDRVLGLSGFTSNTTVVLLLAGLGFGQLDMFVDLALGYAMLGFVGVLAAARYFERAPR